MGGRGSMSASGASKKTGSDISIKKIIKKYGTIDKLVKNGTQAENKAWREWASSRYGG